MAFQMKPQFFSDKFEAPPETCETAMGWYTAQNKMLLFCEKMVMKESLVHLKQKKKQKKKKKKARKTFGCLATFWFDTFLMLFHATRYVVGHENT